MKSAKSGHTGRDSSVRIQRQRPEGRCFLGCPCHWQRLRMRNILGDCCRQRYIMLIERARKVVKRHIRNRVQHNLKMVVEMKEGDLGVNAVPFTYNKFRVGHIIPKFIQARIESARRAVWAFTVRRTDIALTTRRSAISERCLTWAQHCCRMRPNSLDSNHHTKPTAARRSQASRPFSPSSPNCSTRATSG